MNVVELENENLKLKVILRGALENTEGWRNEAERALELAKKEDSSKHVHKWEGVQCKTCKHSNTVHLKNSGFCCSPNCDCDRFVDSNKEIN